ncbi:MAG: DegT/DnrJ/EryC1/StrS family aminotransferase [Desulfovibrionaceae bacterium]
MTSIKYPLITPHFDAAEERNVLDCVRSGWVSSRGAYVREFEKRVAAYCGAQYAISTSNGTTALHLALVALNIGPGDEVIVPSISFIATSNAVVYTGATPVFVDIERAHLCIDPDCVKAAITERTRCILPVHLYGHPCNMDAIGDAIGGRDIFVVEDAAESLGAEYNGKHVGAIGDIGIFSFYGNKIITTGEGGMVVTNSCELYDKMMILRDHGMDPQRPYRHKYVGYNYRMTNLQAALGVAQMDKVDLFIKKKREINSYYRKYLSELPQIQFIDESPEANNVYWLNTILVTTFVSHEERDALIRKLHACGVESRPIFYPLHLQSIYSCSTSAPVAESVAVQGVSLPSSVDLEESDVFEICRHVKTCLS